MTKLNNEICFIVPCYNEENNINCTLDEINKVIKKLNVKYYEIIVVDDLSTDNSRNILLEYENHPKINVIFNKINIKFL